MPANLGRLPLRALAGDGVIRMSLIKKGPVVFLLVLTACAAHAERRTEERALAPFSKLRVENGIDVSLIQGDRPSVTIDADDNLLKDIVTEVDGGELRISRTRNSGRFFGSDAKVRLTFVQLSGIRASGGSDIDGGSDVKLDELSVSASGGSDIAAGDLRADRVTLRVSGGSDAHVNAKDAIELDASGGSDVTVSGDPQRRAVNNDRSSDVRWR